VDGTESAPTADDKAATQLAPAEAPASVLVNVRAEDYGASIPMPWYGGSRPNLDYYLSNLNVSMFNSCDLTTGLNHVLLYDERTAGKAGSDLCSLRFYLYTRQMKELLRAGKEPPSMLLRVTDNCVGQNNSEETMAFDALLSLLFYKRIGHLFLLSGHSHMKPDATTSHVKARIRKKNVWAPEQLVSNFNEVKNVRASFIAAEDGVFRQWGAFLKKHFVRPPTGFTKFHCYEYERAAVHYKYLSTTDESEARDHCFVTNGAQDYVRRAVLKELFGLGPSASLADILNAPLLLPLSPCRALTTKKRLSLSKKLPLIPPAHVAFYPPALSPEEELALEREESETADKGKGKGKKREDSSKTLSEVASEAAGIKLAKGTNLKKDKTGDGKQVSILKMFQWAGPPAAKAGGVAPTAPAATSRAMAGASAASPAEPAAPAAAAAASAAGPAAPTAPAVASPPTPAAAATPRVKRAYVKSGKYKNANPYSTEAGAAPAKRQYKKAKG
jgi:hypothetical protein